MDRCPIGATFTITQFPDSRPENVAAIGTHLVGAYCDGMERLGACTGLRILSDGHLELRDLSSSHGVRYKPSGAGGGDMGMAFAADERSLESAAVAFHAAGYVMLDARADPIGLVIET